MTSFKRFSACLSVFSSLLFIALPASAQRGRGGFAGPPLPQDLSFKFMGPAVGNRIAAAAGVPGDPTTYYAGAASGGVWKSTDSAQHFVPIFDKEDVMAIGALAVADSDHKTVWAGTGEAWAIRDSDMMGDGVYKSTDAGATWQHMGLVETGRIGRILIHPKDANIVYVCALGRTTGAQQERGVYKTTDGGATWTRSLFADPNTGCSGLSMDPNDPNTLFAGTWQVEMHAWGMFSGGPGSGVWVTHDAGAHWSKIEGHGMPHPNVGKVDVAVAKTDSKRVYALIQTADQGSIWRSDDGGVNWTNGSWQRELVGRAGYYIHIAVSPTNADEVIVTNSSVWQSLDGGKHFRNAPWGGDTHDIWMDPDGKRLIITHDGGMTIALDHTQNAGGRGGADNAGGGGGGRGGAGTIRVTLPIGQMYHVAVDNDYPYKVYGNMQDDGTMRGLSTVQEQGNNVPGQEAPAAGGGGRGGRGRGGAGAGGVGAWEHGLGGCESGFTLPDLTDTNIVWASCYGDEVTRYDARRGTAHSVSPYFHTLDSAPTQTKYRCHWTPPLAIDPFDHNTVYYGCQVIFKTSNGGNTWSVISPDLSTRDPKYIVSSGGIVGDNLGQFYGEVVFAIAPSEIRRGLIWAGTNDGKVWNTQDGGAHWNDVTANIPGLPPLGVVSKIEPSHFDPATAYLCVDFHLNENRDPWVYRTNDYGKTWTKISNNLPTGHPLAYARAIAENPNKKGNLFVGTGHGFFYSLDDGATWKQFKQGLPAAPVTWIVVQKNEHDVVVSTYGRGIYIMDDITALEQGLMEPGAATTALATPRTAFREPRSARAVLDFKLSAVPKSPVEIEITDAKGATVAKVSNAGHAGLNRVGANLVYPGPRLIALRTTPPENPNIWDEPRFNNAQTRGVTHWGIEGSANGPTAGPGTYTVKMTVDGQSFTQPLKVTMAPGSHGSDADVEASVRLELKVRDDISTVSDMANQLEWMRRQLEDEKKTVEGKAAVLAALSNIDKKLKDVELRLLSESEMLSDDKYYVEAYKLYLNFIWLGQEIGGGGGDTAGSADYGPTETQTQLVLDLEKQLAEAQVAYKGVMDKDVPAYNQQINGSGLKPLQTTGAPPAPPRAGRGGGGN